MHTVAILLADEQAAHDSLAVVVNEQSLFSHLFSHAVGEIINSGCIDRIAVIASDATKSVCESILSYDSTHFPDIYRSLCLEIHDQSAVINSLGDRDQVVLHHVRYAYAPSTLIKRVSDALESGADSVLPVVPTTDTIKYVRPDGRLENGHDRDALRIAQFPRGFASKKLRQKPIGELMTIDPGALLIPGHPAAISISTSFDLTLATACAGATT